MPDRYLCLVCGYGGLGEPPWRDGTGSDEICPSCGIHFGYDDAAGGDPAAREAVYRGRRGDWIAGGMRWWSSGDQPPDWDPICQLEGVRDVT
jgi:hypothetical protein